MAGVNFKVENRQFLRRMKALIRGTADASPLMKVWGEIAVASVIENFEKGGRPTRWQKLSPVTVQMKGHARPLIGRTGNLRRITVKPGQTNVIIGSNPATKDYAAIQQFGGKAGRGRKVTIPARPFLVLQEEDKVEMAKAARQYLKVIGS